MRVNSFTEIDDRDFNKKIIRRLKKTLKKLLNSYRKAKVTQILVRMNCYFINRKTESDSM